MIIKKAKLNKPTTYYAVPSSITPIISGEYELLWKFDDFTEAKGNPVEKTWTTLGPHPTTIIVTDIESGLQNSIDFITEVYDDGTNQGGDFDTNYIVILDYGSSAYDPILVDAYNSDSIYTLIDPGGIGGKWKLGKYHFDSDSFVAINSSNTFGNAEQVYDGLYASKDVVFLTNGDSGISIIDITTGIRVYSILFSNTAVKPSGYDIGAVFASNYNNELFYTAFDPVTSTTQFRKWSYETLSSTLLHSVTELLYGSYPMNPDKIGFAGPNRTYPYLSRNAVDPDGYYLRKIDVCNEAGTAYNETLLLADNDNATIVNPVLKYNSGAYKVWVGYNNLSTLQGIIKFSITPSGSTQEDVISSSYDTQIVTEWDKFEYIFHKNTIVYLPSSSGGSYITDSSSLSEEAESPVKRLIYNYPNSKYKISGADIFYTFVFGGPLNELDTLDYVSGTKIIECKDNYTLILGYVGSA